LIPRRQTGKIVYVNQIMPPCRFPYPAKYESLAPFVTVPTSHSPDSLRGRAKMKECFYSFSEQTRLPLRFHATSIMPHNKLQLF
jgi:hypothetical protein